eukprot:scaffold24_cov341-Pavlova_lutheri.AAC.73
MKGRLLVLSRNGPFRSKKAVPASAAHTVFHFHAKQAVLCSMGLQILDAHRSFPLPTHHGLQAVVFRQAVRRTPPCLPARLASGHVRRPRPALRPSPPTCGPQPRGGPPTWNT